MEAKPPPNLEYDSQKRVFQYLRVEARKYFRQGTSQSARQAVAKTLDNAVPYHIDQFSVRSDGPDTVKVEIDENRGLLPSGRNSIQWEFTGQRVVVRHLNPQLEVLRETRFETTQTMMQNLQKWFDSYINRPNTFVRAAIIRDLPATIILSSSFKIDTLLPSSTPVFGFAFLQNLQCPINLLYLRKITQELTQFDSVQSAKTIQCSIDASELDLIHLLPSANLVLTLESDVRKTDIVSFIRSIEIYDRAINSTISFKLNEIYDDQTMLDTIIETIYKDRPSRWEKKYLNGRECASYFKDAHEVNVTFDGFKLEVTSMETNSASINPPDSVKLSYNLAWKMFRGLSYHARENIAAKSPFFKYRYIPLQARTLRLRCENGAIVEADLNGVLVQDFFFLLWQCRKGTRITNVFVKGACNEFRNYHKIHAENLILESNEPYPATFFKVFHDDPPKYLTVSNRGSLVNGTELVGKVDNLYIEPDVKAFPTKEEELQIANAMVAEDPENGTSSGGVKRPGTANDAEAVDDQDRDDTAGLEAPPTKRRRM